jgi:hypothetical protein
MITSLHGGSGAEAGMQDPQTHFLPFGVLTLNLVFAL